MILHSSPGFDGRGAFYAEALNQAGIATVEIDYMQGKGIPASPAHNLPHAYETFAVSGRASADRSYADRHHGFLLRWPHLRFDQFRGADPTAHRRQASVCRAPGPVSVRAGIHNGECEVLDGRVTGIAVHLGARIAASATANELLVSSTVKDLMAGSGIDFEDRGLQELRGVPGQWRLFAVKTATVLA